MEQIGWYNGYDWNERDAKLNELKRRIARKEQEPASGPCALCNDPDVAVEYHDEDYSKPYIWSPPALLALCRNCHRDKLHKRFGRPSTWLAFLAHIRRGGYARELKDPAVKKELLCIRLRSSEVSTSCLVTFGRTDPPREPSGSPSCR